MEQPKSMIQVLSELDDLLVSIKRKIVQLELHMFQLEKRIDNIEQHMADMKEGSEDEID